MGLGYIFDLNRVVNLETKATETDTTTTDLDTRTGTLEATVATHTTDIANKVSKTGGNTLTGTVNITGTNNSLVQTVPITSTVWNGVMKDASTYSYALGRFNTSSDVVEMRAYLDKLVFKTGRAVGAANADMNFITNENGGAISANINMQPKGDFNVYPGNGGVEGFRFYLSGGSYPTLAAINKAVHDVSLKFGGTSIQARNGNDDAYQSFVASAFTVSSERDYKEDISLYDQSVLDQIKDVPVRSYTLKGDPDKQTRMGLIRDEAPEQITKEDTIDLYQMCSMLWKAVQELTDQVEALKV